MPGNKRWHFELRDNAIFIFRDGKEISRFKKDRDIPMGPVKEIFYGAEHPQAKSFKAQAIEVTFQSGYKNRNNFEWNKSLFNEEFKTTTTAADFISVWNKVTKLDAHHGFAMPNVDSCSQSNSDAMSTSCSSSQDSTVVHSKHPLPDADSSLPAAKRTSNSSTKDQHANPIDDTILSKRIGLFQLPVTNLTQPQTDLRLIRKLDTTFVSNLKKRIAADPSGPGVPPIAVLCTGIDDFSERYKDSYRYEVLGGQHTAAAKAELLKENPGNSLFNQVFAEVYMKLTDKECLRLASRHNTNGHFIHKMSHKDYIQSCRAMLYSMSNEDIPTPTVRWKEICKECILSSDMSRTQCENIFSQAAFSPPVWEQAIKLIELFEDGKLKNQKLNKKSLVSKPEFKQQHFQCIHNLNPSFQQKILEQAVNREITLDEVKKKASEYRALENIRKAFTKCTNSTWDEAKERYPWHTTDDRLKQFLGLNFVKNMPDSFRGYCTSAMRGQRHQTNDNFSYEGSDATTMEVQMNELTVAAIQSAYPSYSGANLILACIPKDWTDTQIKEMVLICRQLNNVEQTLSQFNVAIVCSSRMQGPIVEEALKQCIDHVEMAYYYDQSISCSGGGYELVDAVSLVVFGHFSIDGQLKKEHFTEKHHNIFVVQGKRELMGKIIELFSFTGQTILDIVTDDQHCSIITGITALKKGRNYIGIVESHEAAVAMRRQIAEMTNTSSPVESESDS